MIFLAETDDPFYFERCKVPLEFSANQAKVSPDGKFTFKLLTDESHLDYEKVSKMRVYLKGFYVPFESKKGNQTLIPNYFNQK